MAWKIPKPKDRSILGLKAGPLVAGSWLLARGDTDSLEVDLGDFLFSILIPGFETQHPAYVGMVNKYNTVGYELYLYQTNRRMNIRLNSAPGAQQNFFSDANAIPLTGPVFMHIFGDRDGNVEFYSNGVDVGTSDISGVNIDQSNTGNVNMFYTVYGGATDYMNTGLLHFSYYNFGVGGIPALADRQNIVKQFISDPWNVPLILSARPAYATEQRLLLDFKDLDPAWNYIKDSSPYATSISLSGGHTVATAVKEFMTP